MKATLEQIAEKIKSAKTINVFGHIKTDCDCVSSLLAFKLMCESFGKKVFAYVDSEIGSTLKHLPQVDQINKYPLKRADLAVSLDTATSDRLGEYRHEVLLHNNSIRIDHHGNTEPYTKFEYVDSSLPATCLILKKLQKYLGVPNSRDLNFLLLSGTLTDSGCFKYNSTNSETLELASKMIKNAEFDYASVVIPLFNTLPKRKRLLQGRAINNMQFFSNDQIALIFLSNADLKEFGATLADTGGMSFLAQEIDTVKINIIVSEGKPGEFSVSFNSKGNIDISPCAREFGGGGHPGAAGCKLFGKKDEILPRLIKSAQKILGEQK